MVITVWLGDRKGSAALEELGRKMGEKGPIVMGLAAFLGFLSWLLLLNKYEHDLMQMMAAINMGWGLLLLLLLLGFWGLYMFKTNNTWIVQNPFVHTLLGGMTIGCMLTITLVFVVSQVMMMNPAYSDEVVRNGLMTSLDLPTVWPRFFHIVLAGLGGTGMIITVYGTLRASQATEPSDPENALCSPYDVNMTRYGLSWTLAGILPQIVVGPWLLMTLPPEVRERLVDGGSMSSLVFFVSLTFALLALVLLNASLMVPHVRGLVWSGMVSLFLTIMLMVVVREEVRKAWMSSHLGSGTGEQLTGRVLLSLVILTVAGLYACSRYVKFVYSRQHARQTRSIYSDDRL